MAHRQRQKTPLPGRFPLLAPAQRRTPAPVRGLCSRSPGRGDARANVRLVNSPGVYSPGRAMTPD
ncbi:hypothetical protein, partial [Thermanaerothrix sp.]|uniref:hypothetical protein n=1 Tax=Thermanaerothrix sp. TaxID=2972675 RepID=UPI002ADD7BA0